MNTGQYTCLEVFAKAEKPEGKITLLSLSGAAEEKTPKTSYYTWLKFQVEPDTDYRLQCRDCVVSLCYLSGNEKILDTGVQYLEYREGEFAPVAEEVWYDSPMKEQFHFVPWKNWINDPNGLCWFQGRYHMFYQFNPHGQEWSNMYWGHAVSRDLVHWTHLPVVLQPQEEILDRAGEIKGGAFSGSAVVENKEVFFYLTRHLGPMEDCEETVQQQWLMKSKDMIHFSPEKRLIEEPPKGASFDFRDPKVLKIDGRWYMVLASALHGKAAILLYESEDMEHWTYVGPLLVEQEEGIRCFECPDFMELDGSYVAMGALMCHYDAEGRYQMCRYYIGDWKDKHLETKTSGWFDFGSNCYAMQSFEHEGRRICIGWISDFYNEHISVENGAYGSMTLPRELHVKNGKLYMTPVKETELLKGRCIYRGEKERICLEHIENNAYTASIRFSENIPFSILLGKDKEKEISLRNDEKGFFIVTKGTKTDKILFRADVCEVKALEIFTDHRVIEVYVNEGEAAGTKLFYNTGSTGCFVLETEKEACIERAEVSLMHSIWKR